MPDVTMYMTDDDEARFIRFILEEGAWLVPDLDYSEPRVVKITALESYELYRQKLVRKFFIQKDEFNQSPLELRSISKNNKMVHYISQRQGGPYIDFSGGGIFEAEGFRYVRPGECGYYPTYWDTLLRKNQVAPKALRIFYSVLKKFLLQEAKRLLNTKTRPWVLSFAIVAMQNGARLVGFENHMLADLEMPKNGHRLARKKGAQLKKL
jgi:hypothetical protein